MTIQIDAAAASLSAVSAAGAVASQNISVELFGVPVSVLLAGFAGAAAALSFMPAMNIARMASVVMVGTGFSTYGTPLVANAVNVAEKLHLGIAFFLGLTAQVAITWLLTRLPTMLDKRAGVEGPKE